MPNHEERAHALLSASSAHRWMHCTPSARLEDEVAVEESTAAKEGTVAHELCECKLRALLGEDTKEAEKEVRSSELYSPEMERYTQDYAEFCYDAAIDCEGGIRIEEALDLSAYVPEGFGTADCVIVGEELLHVIDFKYGRGVKVSPVENPQLMLYALGAYDLYSFMQDFKTVKLTIVQPRITEVPSSWELPIEDLLAFGEEVKKKAEVAFKGEGEFCPEEDTCRFCKVKATCRARAEKNLALMFLEEQDPRLLSNDELGDILTKCSGFPTWLSDVEECAKDKLLLGEEVKGWKIVEGRSTRVWTDETDAFKYIVDSEEAKEEELYETIPLTLSKVEKLIGKKRFKPIAEKYVTKSKGKPTLTLESDERPAYNSVETMFNDEGEN